MNKNDSLFDGKWTWLDTIKVALLIVTAFSTWNIVDLITPDMSLSFVRELAALVVVEGAYLAMEYATSNAKSKKQVDYATKGFFASLFVIVAFALTSGALEFGGDALLLQPAGVFMGLEMLARDWVMVAVLSILAVWIGGLGSIFRLYSLADPEKISELATISLNETVATEANAALTTALEKARPVIATARAVAHVREQYASELKPDELAGLVRDVKAHLDDHYAVSDLAVDPAVGFVPTAAVSPSPLPEADGDQN